MPDLAEEVEKERKILAVYPILEWFQFSHLPPKLQESSRVFYDTAWQLVKQAWVESSSPAYPGFVRHEPELEAGLRKLLEAKDCMVRASKKLG